MAEARFACTAKVNIFKPSIKPTTLNTNEQEKIRSAVADPVACVVSMPPKYQLYSW